ncbi:putative serine/threonine-protein kinase iks1 [Coemansia nantahalensis]|nr:putative serine/threonine-protein kinase iks1 [Coemansia nantahalensis]
MNLLLQWKDPSHKDAADGMPRIMLTDFGECEILSHLEKRDRTGATGTMEFMAPELLAVDATGRYLDSYSTKSDMWSLGMVLHYLCYGRLPFVSTDDIDALRRDVLRLRHVNFAAIRRPSGAEEIPQELRRTIQLLLNHDETKRPDIGDVVQLVSEHSDLWHSRQFGRSRFVVHDSTFADEESTGSMPYVYRRHSTGNQLLLQGDVAISADVAYKGSGEADVLDDSSSAASDAGGSRMLKPGTKRRRAALDGSGDGLGSSKAAKLRQSVAGLEIGPAFCRIGAALDLPSEQMMHMACVSLTLSALDIHHQSLLLTALLLVANVGVVCVWLCLAT